IGDEVPAVRLAALAAADRILGHGAAGAPGSPGGGDDALIAAVTKRMSARSWEERTAAAAALGAAPPAAASSTVPPLVAALGDPSGFVREAAARSLGGLHRPGPVGPLLGAARDEVAAVRVAAVRGLVQLAPAEARAQHRCEELVDSDPDPRVREAARAAARH